MYCLSRHIEPLENENLVLPLLANDNGITPRKTPSFPMFWAIQCFISAFGLLWIIMADDDISYLFGFSESYLVVA